MNTKIIILFLSCCLFFACTPNGNSEQQTDANYSSPKVEALFNEVMVVHDEVMPFVSNMKRQQKQLRERKEELEAANQLDETQAKAYTDAIRGLAAGNEAMFAWMGEFQAEKMKAPEVEALAYLNIEKQKITAVNELMKSAIEAANALLPATSSE